MRDTAIRKHPVRIANLVLPPSAGRALGVPLEALQAVAPTVACVCEVVAFERIATRVEVTLSVWVITCPFRNGGSPAPNQCRCTHATSTVMAASQRRRRRPVHGDDGRSAAGAPVRSHCRAASGLTLHTCATMRDSVQQCASVRDSAVPQTRAPPRPTAPCHAAPRHVSPPLRRLPAPHLALALPSAHHAGATPSPWRAFPGTRSISILWW